MEVVWLPSADEAFRNLLRNVENLFGTLVARQVAERIYSHIDLLASFPDIGVCDPRFSKVKIRYLVNTPNLIYYTRTLNSNKVIIISILNSRQSPDNIYQVLADALKTNNVL